MRKYDTAAHAAMQPLQARAYRMVRQAILAGDLPSPRKLQCADCGAPAWCYDHRDYSKPLEVEPACRSCNSKRGSALPYRAAIS